MDSTASAKAPGGRRQPVLGILPGEGIGPEVVGAALRALDALESVHPIKFDRVVGNHSASHDGNLTNEETAFCRDIFDRGGVLFCGPRGGRFVYDLRRQFDLFCKLVPIRPLHALHNFTQFKPHVLRGVDILIVRDNAGGVYQGQWQDRIDPAAGRLSEHRFCYSEKQVQRIVAAAAKLAQGRRNRLHVVIKAGGVPGISQLWRDVADQVAAETKIDCEFLNVDHAAYRLIQHPNEFDVLVTPNLFGDVLGDLGAALLGSRGMSFSANFSDDGRACYQTGHGAAFDLAGSDRANPAAQILSLAMMLRESFGLDDAAMLVERAVQEVFLSGWRTDDLAMPASRSVGARQMADLIAKAVLELVEDKVSA
jgi:3-isopropylmalate dehydrogenase